MHEQAAQADPPTISGVNRFKFAAVRGLLWVLLKCTSLRGLYLVGHTFGLCEWAVNYKRRQRFRRRMEQMFGTPPPPDTGAACRRFFVRTRCDKFFYLIFDMLPRDRIIERIHFPDRGLIDASLRRERGVYIALSHHGAQHVAGLLMSLLGYQVGGVRDPNEGPLRRYIRQRLARRFSELQAVRMFYADAFPRDLYRWFKTNHLLGSALDVERVRDPHLKRSRVRVFGEERQYLTGTVQIALRCRAAIHQGFIVSRPWFRYALLCSEPLVDPDVASDTPEVLQDIMQRYADNIEAHVRKYPDHISKV